MKGNDMLNDYKQMAEKFLADHNATMTIEFREEMLNPWGGNTGYHNAYDVTIERNGESMTVDFKDSAYNRMMGNEPSAYDILSCLEKYGFDSYKDYCEEYGILGSEESLATYQAIKREYDDVMRLFGDCVEELQEIQ